MTLTLTSARGADNGYIPAQQLGGRTSEKTDKTTDETTSHPTKAASNQVVGYSHPTKQPKDGCQVVG
jgi:hypothetical protein